MKIRPGCVTFPYPNSKIKVLEWPLKALWVQTLLFEWKLLDPLLILVKDQTWLNVVAKEVSTWAIWTRYNSSFNLIPVVPCWVLVSYWFADDHPFGLHIRITLVLPLLPQINFHKTFTCSHAPHNIKCLHGGKFGDFTFISWGLRNARHQLPQPNLIPNMCV